MILNKLGILGWDHIEPIVLAALVTKEPIMFVGDHGANKTEGSYTLSQASLGDEVRFQTYDCPTIQTDDLLGYPNPEALKEGRPMEFVPTGISVWDKQAILLDELNKASHFVQAKLLELVRTRRVMGLPTQIRQVFAAINPPEKYSAVYMDLALASRFVIVKVPGIKELHRRELMALYAQKGPSGHKKLFSLLSAAGESSLDKKEYDSLIAMGIKLATEISKLTVYSVRQMQMLIRLLISVNKIRNSFGRSINLNYEQLVTLVASTIPQLHGITTAKVSTKILEGNIKQIIMGFQLKDPLITSVDIVELISAPKTQDMYAWAAETSNAISHEKSKTVALKAAKALAAIRGNIPEDTFNVLAGKLLLRIHKLKGIPAKYQDIPFNPNVFKRIVKELFQK